MAEAAVEDSDDEEEEDIEDDDGSDEEELGKPEEIEIDVEALKPVPKEEKGRTSCYKC